MTRPRPSSQKRLADFFAGIGLVELALQSLGWKTAIANDISEKKQQIYGQNFDPSRYIVRMSINYLPNRYQR